MKPKFKPGDVVELVGDCLGHPWSTHFKRLNGATFLVHSPAIDDGVHLLRMNGKKVLWPVSLYGGTRERGVWEGWLQRNEFLTAVHKAQKRKENT